MDRVLRCYLLIVVKLSYIWKNQKTQNRPHRNDFCVLPSTDISSVVVAALYVSMTSRTLCEIPCTIYKSPGERVLWTTVSECGVSWCPTLHDRRQSVPPPLLGAQCRGTVCHSSAVAVVPDASYHCDLVVPVRTQGGRCSHMPLVATFILEFKIFLTIVLGKLTSTPSNICVHDNVSIIRCYRSLYIRNRDPSLKLLFFYIKN